MATTETGHHRLEVESLTAKAVASKILSTMDVDPSEVTEFEVTIESDGDGETTTVINSAGPKAGEIVSPMLQAADWNEHEPRKIQVNVQTTPEEDEAEDEPLAVDEPEDEDTEEDEDVPSVSVGTNAHAAITAIAAYIWKNGLIKGDRNEPGHQWTGQKPSIMLTMLYEGVEMDLTKEQLKDALGHCLRQGLVENVGQDGRGSDNYYHLNQNGWHYLREQGPSEDVESFPLDELLPGNQKKGPTPGFTYSDPDRGEYAREEPDVDEPQQVKVGTRPHQALTVLMRMSEEYGDKQWVSAEGVYNYPDGPNWPNQTAASKTLSDLFLKHALCRRKRDKSKSGLRCLYQINKYGQAELRRIGRADI